MDPDYIRITHCCRPLKLLSGVKLRTTLLYTHAHSCNVSNVDVFVVQAVWRDAYEPYVVVRTATMPRFNEDLLERMGDKIAYGRVLYAQGWVFYLLEPIIA